MKPNPQEPHWVYAFVRTDLPVSQQAIQASHAILEMGLRHKEQPAQHPSFVYLEVPSKHALEQALAQVSSCGIKAYSFHESYSDWGLTSFATEPIPASVRGKLRGFKLWRR